MSISPTEPLSDGAAELALKLYEVKTVALAVSDATSDRLSSATRTYQFINFEFGCLLLSRNTIFHSTVVRFLALETLVVGQLEHGPSCQIIVKPVCFFKQAGVFINAFEFRSYQSFLFYILLYDHNLRNFSVDLGAVFSLHHLFTLRTV